MPTPFQSIGLIGKQGDPAVKEAIRQLCDFLLEMDRQVLLEEATDLLLKANTLPSATLADLPRRTDLVIVVGGDGSMLHAARALAPHDIPLLGINLGRLGFLTDITPTEIRPKLERILTGHYQEEMRFLLRLNMGDESKTNGGVLAFNDIVLHKWNIARMIEFETYINGQLVNDQRADGLIVSTPTGSTAYALSGGGPLIYPSLNALLLVPICPHTLSNRPIVVDGESEIEIRLARGHAEAAQLTCDGQVTLPIMEGEVIRIRKADHQVRLIHPEGHDYYNTLSAKLGWGKYPS